MAELSAYERERLERIQENMLFMQSLGLDKLHMESAKSPSSRRTVSRAAADSPKEASRRSDRIQGRPGAPIQDIEEEDAEWGRRPKKGKKTRRSLFPKNMEPGRRIVGGRVYDSDNGTSCHQCRQKTMDPKVKCTNTLHDRSGRPFMCSIMMDEMCLLGRYGETLEEAMDGEWVCPKCRNICNCSFCRRKKGLAPTGILAPIARGKGCNSVAEFLGDIVSDGSSRNPTPKQALRAIPRTKRTTQFMRKRTTDESEDIASDDSERSDIESSAEEDRDAQQRGNNGVDGVAAGGIDAGDNNNDYDRDDVDDEECAACNNGGTLVCCDTCPLMFHRKCLVPPLQGKLPTVWHCPICIDSGFAPEKAKVGARRTNKGKGPDPTGTIKDEMRADSTKDGKDGAIKATDKATTRTRRGRATTADPPLAMDVDDVTIERSTNKRKRTRNDSGDDDIPGGDIPNRKSRAQRSVSQIHARSSHSVNTSADVDDPAESSQRRSVRGRKTKTDVSVETDTHTGVLVDTNKTASPTPDGDRFEVEAILGVRTVGRRREFFIRWRGYDPSHDTWEPRSNLYCADILRRFLDGCAGVRD